MRDEKEVSKLFGKRLRLLRMSKGLSQEELAHQCGLHRTYIGQIERAEKNVSITKAYRLAETLDLSMDELFDFSTIYTDDKKKK